MYSIKEKDLCKLYTRKAFTRTEMVLKNDSFYIPFTSTTLSSTENGIKKYNKIYLIFFKHYTSKTLSRTDIV